MKKLVLVFLCLNLLISNCAIYAAISTEKEYKSNYSAIQLPEDFKISGDYFTNYLSLTDSGQIAGSSKDKAVVYDVKYKKLILFPEEKLKSSSKCINDYGCVAVEYAGINKNGAWYKQVVFWNTATNIITLGPQGEVLGINNNNKILFQDYVNHCFYIWDSVSNTVQNVIGNSLKYIDDNNKVYSLSGFNEGTYFNKQGQSLNLNKAFFLEDDKQYVIAFPNDIFSNYLRHGIGFNNNGEVFALDGNAVFKWVKNQKINTFSLPYLNDYSYASIISVNSLGYILLNTVNKTTKKTRLVLVAPCIS